MAPRAFEPQQIKDKNGPKKWRWPSGLRKDRKKANQAALSILERMPYICDMVDRYFNSIKAAIFLD
jgi:hypothetical protein